MSIFDRYPIEKGVLNPKLAYNVYVQEIVQKSDQAHLYLDRLLRHAGETVRYNHSVHICKIKFVEGNLLVESVMKLQSDFTASLRSECYNLTGLVQNVSYSLCKNFIEQFMPTPFKLNNGSPSQKDDNSI